MENKLQDEKPDEDKAGGTDAVAEDLASMGITDASSSSTEKARTTERGVDREEPLQNGGKSGNSKGDKEVALEVNPSSNNKCKDSTEDREGDDKGTLGERQSKGDTGAKDTKTGGEGITALNDVDQGGGADRADEHVPDNTDVRGGSGQFLEDGEDAGKQDNKKITGGKTTSEETIAEDGGISGEKYEAVSEDRSINARDEEKDKGETKRTTEGKTVFQKENISEHEQKRHDDGPEALPEQTSTGQGTDTDEKKGSSTTTDSDGLITVSVVAPSKVAKLLEDAEIIGQKENQTVQQSENPGTGDAPASERDKEEQGGNVNSGDPKSAGRGGNGEKNEQTEDLANGVADKLERVINAGEDMDDSTTTNERTKGEQAKQRDDEEMIQ